MMDGRWGTTRMAMAAMLGMFAGSIAAHGQTLLADGGAARFAVVVAENASAETRRHAETLAGHLGRISGAAFTVRNGSGRTGIAVGQWDDFPDLADPFAGRFDSADPFRRDEYLLRSHEKGLLLLGSTPTAVGHAVWDCLYRLGCRWYFPFENWEIIPQEPRPSIEIDVFEQPDFVHRSISGIGYEEDCAPLFREWALRNRLRSGFDFKHYHVYQRIIAEFKSEFAAHPEYYGLQNGKRTSHKLCIANPGLRELAVRFATNYLARHPGESCVSMEPSDGAGWCECAACAALGSPSDRAVRLANHVARALRETHPGVFVGMLAYHQHFAPPELNVEPNVIVALATRYGTGGQTWSDVARGWRTRAMHLGMYDYLSLWMTHRGLPGGGKATNTERVVREIAETHAEGFRFFNGESCDGWGATGLGHYLISRALWDVSAVSRREELMDDFLRRCFGAAEEPMRRFYELIDGRNAPLMSGHLVGRLYRQLDEAHQFAGNDAPRVASRLDDLTTYVRYVELYRAYRGAPAAEGRKQAAYENLVRHVYRIRGTGMVNTKAWFVYPERGLARPLPSTNPHRAWRMPQDEHPWKSGKVYTREEIATLRAEGIARNPVIEYLPFMPTSTLRPGEHPPETAGTFGDRLGPHTLLLGTRQGRLPSITFSSGHHKTGYGGVRWRLTDTDGTLVQTGEIPPDKHEHLLALGAPGEGVYRLDYEDSGAGTRWSWDAGAPVVAVADRRQPLYGIGQRNVYFHVPAGTRRIVAWVSSMASVTFRAPSGQVFRHDLESWPDMLAVEVPEGQDGKAWSLGSSLNGQFALLNVPPYLARSPDELLVAVPEEIAGQKGMISR